jgi:hypothetical protein
MNGTASQQRAVRRRAFQGREKQDVFPEAYRDVFTAALKSPPPDRALPALSHRS